MKIDFKYLGSYLKGVIGYAMISTMTYLPLCWLYMRRHDIAANPSLSQIMVWGPLELLTILLVTIHGGIIVLSSLVYGVACKYWIVRYPSASRTQRVVQGALAGVLTGFAIFCLDTVVSNDMGITQYRLSAWFFPFIGGLLLGLSFAQFSRHWRYGFLAK